MRPVKTGRRDVVTLFVRICATRISLPNFLPRLGAGRAFLAIFLQLLAELGRILVAVHVGSVLDDRLDEFVLGVCAQGNGTVGAVGRIIAAVDVIAGHWDLLVHSEKNAASSRQAAL